MGETVCQTTRKTSALTELPLSTCLWVKSCAQYLKYVDSKHVKSTVRTQVHARVRNGAWKDKSLRVRSLDVCLPRISRVSYGEIQLSLWPLITHTYTVSTKKSSVSDHGEQSGCDILRSGAFNLVDTYAIYEGTHYINTQGLSHN